MLAVGSYGNLIATDLPFILPSAFKGKHPVITALMGFLFFSSAVCTDTIFRNKDHYLRRLVILAKKEIKNQFLLLFCFQKLSLKLMIFL